MTLDNDYVHSASYAAKTLVVWPFDRKRCLAFEAVFLGYFHKEQNMLDKIIASNLFVIT